MSVLLLLCFACSDDDVTGGTDSTGLVDEDTATDSTTDSTTDSATDTETPPPPTLAALVDHSVNQASAVADGPPDPLVLVTGEGTNEAGAFNGGGTGNKAIAGVPGLDGRALSAFEGISFEARSDQGTQHAYLNVQVDLTCGGEATRILVVDAQTFGDPEDLGEGWRSYAAAADEAQWKVVGGLDDLLPGHLESTGAALGPVLEAYPQACLRDADTGDGGMPAGEVTSAVMLVLGDSGTTSANTWTVRRVTVDSESWAPSE